MIDYYEALSGAEQAQVSESIRLLYRQTFLLERTYDRESKRYQTRPEFYQCSQHLELSGVILPLWELRSWRTASWDLSISAGSR